MAHGRQGDTETDDINYWGVVEHHRARAPPSPLGCGLAGLDRRYKSKTFTVDIQANFEGKGPTEPIQVSRAVK